MTRTRRGRRPIALVAVIAAGLVVAGPLRARAGIQTQVDQAAAVLARFGEIPESAIPEAVLRDAEGLAIITAVKAGFIFSGSGGHGVVVARVRGGWSGPSAIATGGAGFGLQVGAQVTEFVIVLNTPEAVAAFSRGGNVAIGADVSGAAGPMGRDLRAEVLPVAAVYTYSRSQGLFAGASLEGTVIVTRDEVNAAYYGRSVTAEEILAGRPTPPAGAAVLTRALSRLAAR